MFKAGHVLYTVDIIDRKTFKQPILDHGRAAFHRLLTRLKDEPYGSVKVFGFCQVFPCREQHRGVAIVPAEVGVSRDRTFVLQIVVFLNSESVKVGTEANGAVAVPGGEGGDHCMLSDACLYLISPLSHLVGNKLGRVLLFHGEFRISVHLFKPFRHLLSMPFHLFNYLLHIGLFSVVSVFRFLMSSQWYVLIRQSRRQRVYPSDPVAVFAIAIMVDEMAATTIRRFTPSAICAASRLVMLPCRPM